MADAFVHLKASGSSEEPSPAGSKSDAEPARSQQTDEPEADVLDISGRTATDDLATALAHAARTVPQIPPRPSEEHVKILVVGERGVGKTTLLQNLLASYGGARIFQQAPKAATSLANFREAPEALAMQVPVALSDTATLVYTIQEAPGYGDDLDVSVNIAAVADYLEACAQAQAAEAPSPLPDHSLKHLVDICLYLLPPRHLAASDAAFIRRLAPLVAVQPVLARADALPVADAAAIRDEAAAQLFRPPVAKRKARSSPKQGAPEQIAPAAPSNAAAGGGSHGAQEAGDSAEDTATSRCTAAAEQPAAAADAGRGAAAAADAADAAAGPFRFSDAALAAVGVQDAAFLPAVVAGEVLSDEHEVPWPLRRCRFGPPLEALNPEHSDLLLLKRLVLEEGHHELRAAKAACFATWTEARSAATTAAAAAAATTAAYGVAAKAIVKTAADMAAQRTTGPVATASGSQVSGAPHLLQPTDWAKGSLSFGGPTTTATGTRRAAYRPFRDFDCTEAERSSGMFNSVMHHIAATREFEGWSVEELRWQDYQADAGLRPTPASAWLFPRPGGSTLPFKFPAELSSPPAAAAPPAQSSASDTPAARQQTPSPVTSSPAAWSSSLASQLSGLSLGLLPAAAAGTAKATAAPAFSLSLADSTPSMSLPNSSRSDASAPFTAASAANEGLSAAIAASPAAALPLNPAAPSFVFGDAATALGRGGSVLQSGNAFGGQVTTLPFSPAALAPAMVGAHPHLQAATARPYQFGASPRLGQFVFGGVPTLTSVPQPAAAQQMFSNRQGVFGDQQSAAPPPTGQLLAAAAGPAFAGASGVTFGTLAAAAVATSQPAAASTPVSSAVTSAAAFAASAASAATPSISIGASPLSAVTAPLPFGIPAGPFPLPSPTFGFGDINSKAPISGNGISASAGSTTGTAAAAPPASQAAIPMASASSPAANTPDPAASTSGAQQPVASTTASSTMSRPPIPRVPIAAVVSAAAAASLPPPVAADTPRSSSTIETPRASAAKKPKSEKPDAQSKSEEAPQPRPGRLFSPPWTGSAAFIVGPADSKSSTAPTHGGTATSPAAAAAAAAAFAAGSGVSASGNGDATTGASPSASPPLTFASSGSGGTHATRARTPSSAASHGHHHSHSTSRPAAAAAAAASRALAGADVAPSGSAAAGPASRDVSAASASAVVSSPLAASAPFVGFGAGSSGGAGGSTSPSPGAKAPAQHGHGRGRGGGRGHSHSRSR